MVVKTQCRKCGVTIKLDFDNMTKEQALAAAEQLDHTPRECPGQHVELGGWMELWDIMGAIHRAFDLGEGEGPEPVMTDKEYVGGLLAEGKDIIDGGCNTAPELNLPSIHQFPDLDHMGFGNFKNKTELFLRCDSPRGTRFYERIAAGTAQQTSVPA